MLRTKVSAIIFLPKFHSGSLTRRTKKFPSLSPDQGTLTNK